MTAAKLKEEYTLFLPNEEQGVTFANARYERKHRTVIKILVVEDQSFSKQLLSSILDRSSYDTYIASTAREGLEIYISHAPDVAFLDIGLPGDVSGHDLAAAINRLDPDPSIIMVTGNNNMEDVRRAGTNRVAGFVVKPYSRKQILDIMQKLEREKGKKAVG